jgi:hypothetical protein
MNIENKRRIKMKNTLLKISWENKPLPIAGKENLDNLLEEVKTHGVVDVKKFNPQRLSRLIRRSCPRIWTSKKARFTSI